MKRVKNFINKIKSNPRKFLLESWNKTKKYFKTHILFVSFIAIIVLSSTVVRCFTVRNYFSIKPIIADTAIALLVGAFGYKFNPKKRIYYYLPWSIFFMLICIINSSYYTFYDSFPSISFLSTSKFIGDVSDAVVQNVLQLKDLIYILGPIALLMIHSHLKKKTGYYAERESKYKKKKSRNYTLLGSLVCVLVFMSTLTAIDVGRFIKQWNREYLVMRFGVYTYHINDLVKSLEPKVSTLFGYDKAMRNFHEYYDNRKKSNPNEYTNIFEGKNVIMIHAESIQTITMNLKFNGEELTPNLNKLAREGLFFDNFYSQVSVGTSSDTELTLNTSLMPPRSGVAFVSYFDRYYESMPKMFNDKGYYTFSMHANKAAFWNRNIMHKTLGYQKFYSKSSFDVTDENKIGLGLSDKEFFHQAIPMLKEINDTGKPFYGTFIMLSNHTPFDEIEKYGNFPVDIKETIINSNGEQEIVSYPYMEGTKLGNYFKSVHYADEALGQFINDLEVNGLLDNTVIVLYGDHDARLPRKDYIRLYNYDKATDGILSDKDPNYFDFDSYQYELNRKVPLIIWDKSTKLEKTIHDVMGMYDVMPTLGNMFNFYNPYQLGHDIFDIKDDNIVVFSDGNWVTNKVYYNSQKGEYLPLTNKTISEEYIKDINEYADKILEVSNDVIIFDLIKKEQETKDLISE